MCAPLAQHAGDSHAAWVSEPAGPVVGRRRGIAWTRVSHGLHRPADSEDDLPAWSLVLPPSGRFTHLSSAGAYGLWLPPLPPGMPTFAAMLKEESRPQREGL